MKQIKPMIILAAIFFLVILLIPTLLVIPFIEKESESLMNKENKKAEQSEIEEAPSSQLDVDVGVYRSQSEQVETLPLEEYLVGVVAAEMPAEFELEALKAQSLAARTYTVQKLMNRANAGLPAGADITDTVNDQVYLSEKELKEQWGKEYEWKIKKVKDAVKKTEGQILTYKNKPIDATFFSTSNGYTENSESVWSNSIPYLKSVESHWDTKSPKFKNQKMVSVSEFEQKLDVNISQSADVGNIISKTPGKRVDYVQVGNKKIAGTVVRNKLNLSSADFTWKRENDHIVIETKGYGHGIGMSQYGANGMAMEGKSYKDIVTHYYTGVAIAGSDQYVTQLTAKK